jgi:hypothetical protein
MVVSWAGPETFPRQATLRVFELWGQWVCRYQGRRFYFENLMISAVTSPHTQLTTST